MALDTDPAALRAARHNLRLNGLRKRVVLLKGSLPHPAAQGAHLLLANLTARALVDLAPALAKALAAEKGVLVASGLLVEQRQEVEAAFQAHGLAMEQVREEEGWVCLVARRRT